MAYASASDVAALTKALVSGASDYSTSTSPTLAQVNVWLMTGCAVIESRIGTKGYGAIPVSSAAYGVAQQANALYAAWMAERSRTNAGTSAGERTRADYFKKDFEFLLNEVLMGLDLSRMGVTQTSGAYAGGIHRDDKQSVESDTNRVTPRFSRGMYKSPESLEPRGSSAS